MNSKYIAPFYNDKWAQHSSRFHCPHCNVLAQQYWSSLTKPNLGNAMLRGFVTSVCNYCSGSSIWYEEKMIYPLVQITPLANDDLPSDCLEIYNEARNISALSPKGAAALLRLCIQMLMPHLGQKGKNINDDIGALVKAGLPVQVQKALDVCRVVGNNAVHPGEIIFDEDNQVVNTLFGLVNFIVDNQITQPKQLAAMYDALPEKARDGIEKRDA
nr:DUF4145 domain-containing protein [Pantoea dispersa]